VGRFLSAKTVIKTIAKVTNCDLLCKTKGSTDWNDLTSRREGPHKTELRNHALWFKSKSSTMKLQVKKGEMEQSEIDEK